jgi:hypothetical protein
MEMKVSVMKRFDKTRSERSSGETPRNEGVGARKSLKGGQAMMRFRGVFLNALLAASLAAGVAVAQDAPPPPDSQYPSTADQGSTPQYEPQNTPQYATQDSQTMQDQQGPPAPPPPNGQMNTAPGPAAPDQQMVQDNGSDAQDPSSRVARMEFMDGQVSIQPGGVNDWVAGTLNRPMTTGDNVWTDKDSRAELNVGTGIFRMGSETSLTLANVGDKTTQLQLHQGTLNLRVRHLYDGEVYEVDTPNMAFTVQKPGDYRFDVDPNADTSFVTVWKGEGNATGDGPSVAVREHERARFSNGTSMAYVIDKAPGLDAFDEWAMQRDQRIDNSKSAKYVSPDVIGSSDLDDYGNWQENPEYGNVWVPIDQDQDWQPYSNGNWTYEQPYGWTWIGAEPWGFAPYHYGRWVRGGWGWGWAPGPYAYWGSPYYSPAMVAWFGGPGFGIGWGGGWGGGFGGGWGWCALGWGEPFHPWYRHGFGYFRNVNVRNTRITNINNYYGRGYNGHFANAGRGLVAANGRTIQSGMSIRNNRLAMNASQRSQLMQHTVNTHNMGAQLRPTAQSRIGAQAATRRAATPPNRAFSRPTMSRMTPPNHGTTAMDRGGMNTGRPSGAMNNGRNGVARPSGNEMGRGNASTSGHYVPRPPSAGGTLGNRSESRMPSANNPHSSGAYSRPGSSYSRPESTPRSGGNYSSPSRGNTSPSHGAAPSTRSYSSPYGHGYGSPSYSRPSSPSYSARGYGYGASPNYGRSYSAPSSRGRGYSTPNYGGSRGYSAPHYSTPHYSAPSGGGHYGGGGGHASAPSYHGGGGGFHGGGGGGHSSSGGGHSGGRH